MSGSQPATVGELHPLHRKALRHPLILDGLFSASAPYGASARELCLHVLSSFQRTGWSYPPDYAPEARSRARAPSGVSPLGEPYNLTSAFLFVSTPVRVFFVVSGAARSLQRNETRRRTARGLCEPEGLLEDPATAGSRSVQQIYASDPRVSTRVAGTVAQNWPAQPERSHQSDARTFTTC